MTSTVLGQNPVHQTCGLKILTYKHLSYMTNICHTNTKGSICSACCCCDMVPLYKAYNVNKFIFEIFIGMKVIKCLTQRSVLIILGLAKAQLIQVCPMSALTLP